MGSFSYSRGIRFSLIQLQKNWRLFLSIGLVLALAVYAPGFIINAYQNAHVDVSFMGPILVGLSFCINLLLGMGLIKISLNAYDDKKNSITDLAEPYSLFFNYVVGMILYGLIIFAGLILLIIPGIYWGVRFYFYGYAIIHRSLGPVEALKASYALTEGKVLFLIPYFLLIFLINIALLVFLFIGPVVGMIISSLALTYAYRKLLR